MISSGNTVGLENEGNVFSAVNVSLLVRGGDSNEVAYNYFGTDATQSSTFEHSFGVSVNSGGTGNSITNNVFNNINKAIQNRNGGVENLFSRNQFLSDIAIAIDIGNPGLTNNDSGDNDEGPNRRQNTPELSNLMIVDSQLELDLSIDTETNRAAYPFNVEFYLEGPDRVGVEFLGVSTFTESDFAAGGKSVLFDAGSLVSGNRIVAIAIDADGNTSEFSVAGQIF